MRCALAVILVATTTLGAAPAPGGDRLDLDRRALVASQVYASVLRHFGHWRGIPELDLDTAYQEYLHNVLADDGRRAFDLASMEFLARLHNSHSGFDDRWLRERFGQMLGFYGYPIDGQWTITATSLPGLKVGDVIRSIDGRDFEQFYRQNNRYLPASDERWARRSFFEHTYLFPPTFTLGLADGRHVRVTRAGEFQWPGEQYKAIEVRRDGGILYIRIPSFGNPVFEQTAIETLKTLGAERAVILDLRGNHGGSTPTDLVRALMDRPWRWWEEATPFSMGTLETQEDPKAHMEVHSYGSTEEPVPSAYKGPLYLLVDGAMLLRLRGSARDLQGQPPCAAHRRTNCRQFRATIRPRPGGRNGDRTQHEAHVCAGRWRVRGRGSHAGRGGAHLGRRPAGRPGPCTGARACARQRRAKIDLPTRGVWAEKAR